MSLLRREKVRRSTLRCAAVALLVASAWATPELARADGAAAPEAFARVVVDRVELRSGPGISYRVIATASRGETLALDGRPSAGFWLRVTTADGRTAFVLGDTVQTFAVRPGEPDAPSRPGFFAAPPLTGARGGLALLGGLLAVPIADGSKDTFGYFEARPSLVLHETLTLEGVAGLSPTADGVQLLYGGGAQVNLAPRWPVSPYLGLAMGGLSVRPNADSFVLRREDYWVARAGGGLLLALRGRILVRLDATQMALLQPDRFRNAQTFTGGLGVYF